jgi:hypothetical protein
MSGSSVNMAACPGFSTLAWAAVRCVDLSEVRGFEDIAPIFRKISKEDGFVWVDTKGSL